jgi:hypothetical protein
MRTTESLFAEGINDFCNKICHERTHAAQQTTCAHALFDHLVGEREQSVRNLQAECLRGLEIDD